MNIQLTAFEINIFFCKTLIVVFYFVCSGLTNNWSGREVLAQGSFRLIRHKASYGANSTISIAVTETSSQLRSFDGLKDTN